MKTDLLTPEAVRALCIKHGYDTRRGVTEREAREIGKHKSHGIQQHPNETPRPKRPQPCECGEMGTHRIGSDWECERCRKARIAYYSKD